MKLIFSFKLILLNSINLTFNFRELGHFEFDEVSDRFVNIHNNIEMILVSFSSVRHYFRKFHIKFSTVNSRE